MHYYTKAWEYGKWDWLPEIRLYQCRATAKVTVQDETGLVLNYQILPGFRTDGGSVPGMFQWLIRGWYPDGSHNLTNLAFVVHDANYGMKYLHRDLADDLLRGMLRDDQWPRYVASSVCAAVRAFACCHYGKDDLGNADFVRFSTVG